MTNEEAIERIKDHMNIHRMDEPRAIHITEALNIAINALEQQIPKKPISFVHHFNINETDVEITDYRCPICSERDGIGFWSSFIGKNQRRCPNCDTLIDWSELN